ncbi:hypothetical protein Tco_1203421 [Tanacetum coccineum]
MMSLDQNAMKNLDQNARKNLDQNAMKGLDQNAMKNLDQNAKRNLDQNAMTSLDQNAKKNLDQNAMTSLDQNAKKNLDQNAMTSLDQNAKKNLDQNAVYFLHQNATKNVSEVANSTTEAEYVAAANSYGKVLWIQNQMLDYGYNFMNTKIFIDNERIMCIVKNPVFHSKTKHIEIRHHFIRDSYKKRLIQVIKIHTDHNVADLLTKALDVSRFQFLTASIGMLNL